MLRSFRWKLIAWYTVVVAGLAAAFGVLLYANVRRSLFGEAEARLRGRAAALAAAVLPQGDGTFEIDLAPDQVTYFRGASEEAPYYCLWNRRGDVIDRSDPGTEIPRPAAPGLRDRGLYLEVVTEGPGGSLVLVGQNTQPERLRLGQALAAAGGTGVGLVLLAAAGGLLLANRALAPVGRISRAAAAVSASNLSARIDVSRMEAELATLAVTINGAFDRLEQAFDRQARFTADASHELRTPLSIVLTHAELALSRSDRSAEEYREAIATIARAGRRMQAVVEGLLTLAKADAGEARLAREPVDLRQVVEQVCAMLHPLATGRGVGVATDLQPVRVAGDRDRLAEAATNLLSNAIRYNREGGSVDVTLRAEAGVAVLTLADTGVGIPEPERPHVFDRFYRVDASRSRSGGGTGLGLAITKWIAEAHGGSVSCEGRDGGGSVFVLRLSGVERSGQA